MDSTVRFLLVEDNPDHAELVRLEFATNRVENKLDWVKDGEQALAYLRHTGGHALSQRPHVVLLDLHLPRLSGLDTLDAIKGDPALSSISVVLLTSSEAERDRAAGLMHHADNYIVKPMEIDRLRDVVDHLQL